MKKVQKSICALLMLALLLQTLTLGAFAQGNLAASWGQDFNNSDYTPLPGQAVFYHEAGITNYEFTLYKDGAAVYTERIEEGLADFSDWEQETLFLTKFAEYGNGSYKFTVSSLNGDGFTIDTAEVIETAESAAFQYTTPATKLRTPQLEPVGASVLSWMDEDKDLAYAHLLDREIAYGNDIVYDPDYTPLYTEEDTYSAKDLEGLLDYLQAYNPEKYPKANAEIRVRVRSLPEDIRAYQPSDYSNWASCRIPSSSGGGGGPVVISEAYRDAAKVVNNLGLMPDVYQKHDQVVTKGDLTLVVTRLLGLTAKAEGLQDTAKFSDLTVGTELNGCANALSNAQLIVGDGPSTFGADTEMTYAQILRVLVAALGYEPYASASGGWPTGYLSTAARQGISKGISLASDSTVTTEQLAQLIYNALGTKLMEVDSYTMNGPVYKITDNTVLYDHLAMAKLVGKVTFCDDDNATVTDTLYNYENPTGTAVTDYELKIADPEITDYENHCMTLYIDGRTILSGLEYYAVAAKLNGGVTPAKSTTIAVDIEPYGYTKYKLNGGEYQPIPDGTFYVLVDAKHGSKSFSFDFANESESKTVSKSYSIQLENKHTVTYRLNGDVYDSREFGCGEAVQASTPTVEGYRFDGWEALPDTMPDKDLVINAKLTPLAEVKGVILLNGAPAIGAGLTVDGRQVGITDENGAFTFTHGQGDFILTVSSGNIRQGFPVEAAEAISDLGELALTPASTNVTAQTDGVQAVEGLDALLSEEDLAYAQTDTNTVRVDFGVTNSVASDNMSATIAEQYPEHAVAKVMNLYINKHQAGETANVTSISETETPISVTLTIPPAHLGKKEYVVLREHEGTVNVLTTTPVDGEYIEVAGDCITIHAKKFSAYAILGSGVAPKENVYTTEVTQPDLNTIRVDVTAPINGAENPMMYVAFYDGDGRLMKASMKTTIEETNTFDAVMGAADIKVFIWNEKMQPLAE